MFTQLKPPSSYHTVNVAMPSGSAASDSTSASKNHAEKTQITGVSAVAKHLTFRLAAPAALAGRARQSVSLIGTGAHAGALIAYGQGLGAIVVIEDPATGSSSQQLQLSRQTGDHQTGLSLPTFSVHGQTGQELPTALGTVVRFSSGAVSYTVIGSVDSKAARAAARGL